VPNGHPVSHETGHILITVEDGIVLDVCLIPNRDPVEFGTNDGAKQDKSVCSDLDMAVDVAAR
jgi:hypothetical protein